MYNPISTEDIYHPVPTEDISPVTVAVPAEQTYPLVCEANLKNAVPKPILPEAFLHSIRKHLEDAVAQLRHNTNGISTDALKTIRETLEKLRSVSPQETSCHARVRFISTAHFQRK